MVLYEKENPHNRIRGQLGSELSGPESSAYGYRPGESLFNITDYTGSKTITEIKPDIIINCAAYNAVDVLKTNLTSRLTSIETRETGGNLPERKYSWSTGTDYRTTPRWIFTPRKTYPI